jgi:hypothetical protein
MPRLRRWWLVLYARRFSPVILNVVPQYGSAGDWVSCTDRAESDKLVLVATPAARLPTAVRCGDFFLFTQHLATSPLCAAVARQCSVVPSGLESGRFAPFAFSYIRGRLRPITLKAARNGDIRRTVE